MSQHDRALRAARIVLAGAVVASTERSPVRLRTSEDVVPVWRVTAPVGHVTFFAERRLLGQIVRSVQFGDILGDGYAFGIHPRPFANAVAGVHGPGALRREISVPGFCACASSTRKLLAMTIGASESAKVGTLA